MFITHVRCCAVEILTERERKRESFQVKINALESPSPRLSTSCGQRPSMSLVLEGSCSTEGLHEIINGPWKGPGRYWKGPGRVLEGSWKGLGVSVSCRSRNWIDTPCGVLQIVSDTHPPD